MRGASKSEQKHKKYKVVTPSGRTVHFGDTRYEDFTQHRDQKRRESYCTRAMAIKDKHGKLTALDPESPNYYATRLLWSCHLLRSRSR